MPSLRLLASPASDAADNEGSSIVVRRKTVRHGNAPDERQYHGGARQREGIAGEQREYRPLLADHPADKRIDRDQ